MKKETKVAIAEAVLTAAIIAIIVMSITGVFMFAVVEGKSMEPLLQTGDLVFVYRADPHTIHEGDVVVYERPGRSFIIHRVIKVMEEDGKIYFIIKGDNNPVPDGAIPSEWITGKVLSVGEATLKIPGIGYLTLCLRSIFHAGS